MTSTRYGVRTPPPRSAPVGGGRPRGGGVPLWRHIDWVLVGAVALVTSFGALMVYSVTRGPVPPYDTSFVKRVIMFMVIGAVLMAATAMVDYRRLRDYWPFIYGGSVLMLVLVLIPGVGESRSGTQGWFQLGPFQLQPSEMAKLGMIIGFAGLASQFRGDLDNPRILMLLGLCGLPMGLVMLQPDLGTTLVSVAVAFALLLVAGVRPRLLGVLALGAVVVTTLVLTSGVLKEYQVARLTTYVRQDQEATSEKDEETRYNLEQAKLAIGSGGFTGQGLFRGTQTNNAFVPEQRTDFIFTAVGEQLGFLGAAGLLTALGVIVWRIWRTAQLARDDFGMLLCTGIMVMIVIQSFENIGMTVGIMPITGIPLPFMSYGGSALLTMCISIGMVLSVHMRRFS